MNNDMNFNNNKNDGFAIPSAPQYEGYENNYNEQRLDESVKETGVDESKAEQQPEENSAPNQYGEMNDAPMDNDPETTADDDVDIGELVKQTFEDVAEKGTTKNLEKMGLSLPTAKVEKMVEVQNKEAIRNRAKLNEALEDLTSPLQTIHGSIDMLNDASDLLQTAIKKIENPKEVLKERRYKGVGDGSANVFRKYGKEEPTQLTGHDAYMAFSALTGGLWKVYLWNSGITVTLRGIPMDVLNSYLRELDDEGYEYGRRFGAFYYYFSDLAIVEHIIDKILRVAICGSSYSAENNDQYFNKLLRVISWQDFHTLLWAMGAMMHPNGIKISYACGECGHIEEAVSDLSKLHLLNTSLINDDMVEHFRKPKHTDTDLEAYRENLNMKKKIKFKFEDGVVTKEYEFTLRQCSIYEYRSVARDFNAELRKKIDVTNYEEVSSYMQFNVLRCFKPWIDSVSLKVVRGTDNEISNISTVYEPDNPDSVKAMDAILDEINVMYPKFADMMKDYITSTQISKIAFYYPECTKCHAVPELSNEGYLAYDPMYTFFILALRKRFRRSVETI